MVEAAEAGGGEAGDGARGGAVQLGDVRFCWDFSVLPPAHLPTQLGVSTRIVG